MNRVAGALAGKVGDKQIGGRLPGRGVIDPQQKVAGSKYIADFLLDLDVGAGPAAELLRK